VAGDAPTTLPDQLLPKMHGCCFSFGRCVTDRGWAFPYSKKRIGEVKKAG